MNRVDPASLGVRGRRSISGARFIEVCSTSGGRSRKWSSISSRSACTGYSTSPRRLRASSALDLRPAPFALGLTQRGWRRARISSFAGTLGRVQHHPRRAWRGFCRVSVETRVTANGAGSTMEAMARAFRVPPALIPSISTGTVTAPASSVKNTQDSSVSGPHPAQRRPSPSASTSATESSADHGRCSTASPIAPPLTGRPRFFDHGEEHARPSCRSRSLKLLDAPDLSSAESPPTLFPAHRPAAPCAPRR